MNQTEIFISKANLKHEHKYDYSKTVYVKSKSKVVIICPEHGEFEQIPNAHLMGQGCRKCGEIKRHESKKLTRDFVIQKCTETHGDKYDYSRIKYNKVADSVDIICKKHGLFSQALINHYGGQGCPKCGKESMSEKQRLTSKQFLAMALKIHGDRYQYDFSNYENYRSKITITCDIHGPFSQSAENHYANGAGCPSCAVRFSAGETDIAEFIRSKGFTVTTSDRNVIKPLELDIFIPESSLAIEYNGIKWHSDDYGKDKHYHANKTKLCAEKGIRLVHVWEDDWNENQPLQLKFIENLLGVRNEKPIFARKCEIRTGVNKNDINDFLINNHIQGRCIYSESVCLYYNDKLVSVSCFTKRGDNYELVRHCNSRPVIGSLGKTCKHFVKLISKEVYTFLDKARYTGESYTKAGFVKVGEIPPDYSYTKNAKRHHKFLFRKQHIKTKLLDFYDENKTEKQMMADAGYARLWDCGKVKFSMKPD